ncbi:MAG: bifunctional (p)ppGpp synthetase/guanosine-3',5'-bis(diphosphate) 3'-pyrophosphohydrolase ['Candidatus Kapabacteria' thiocyanatum]|uniref:RelA/SpoT family protein n=1 Tax=Candidatus Kapaibacterium thiocyanatum TaxID=1895771 RepID=A0A1M3L6F1_9BACT|nr:bifunctional (p)ppGpp synthetase/guanosine-3',5'-bis(diphosphate) 3'-pyrophosphohydrolase ['Candidatus Kapabacteria' thiocyanatum]OJX61141.1 MAG: RelA/SpoT family protein ['Candidatus Kapabacteria' thiocyanatum]
MARAAAKRRTPALQEPEHIFGLDVEADLAVLLHEGKQNLTRFNEEFVTRAFRFCVEAHRKDVRTSGEPYYTHPLQVAIIVCREIPLDDVSVVAALLHDVVEDTEYSLKDIREDFGSEVADIVDGATKINDVFKSREITQAENYRKLLLSMANDVRVILVKFADRLHNMRTIDVLPRERQERLARETMEIYAPFAHRFGLGNIKWELEDLSFKVLNRSAYDDIKRQLNTTREEREDFIEKFSRPIADRLKENGLKFEISGRPKHLYSIYKKMVTQGKTLDELYDLFAVRIILETRENNDCFLAYGLVSEIYVPVPERFKNYISVPKKNGYQSLHTTVISADGKRVEVQIRTRAMHEFAERGVAAHFRYKAQSGATATWVDSSDLEEWANWVRDIFDSAGDEAPEQLMESFKLNLYQDEIYVFTPKGDLRILPKGATPIDFAFDIHSQVGARCIGAKVNGRIVPLDHKLTTGDQVEILTSRNQTPNRDWERIVITHKAKTHIRRILNEERRARVAEGKDLWEKRAKKHNLHINEDDLERVIAHLKYDSKTDFYAALGTGTLTPEAAAAMIMERLSPGAPAEARPQEEFTFHDFSNSARERSDGIYIVGDNIPAAKVMFSYARCCNPVPGDDIVGIVTIGSGIKVHRTSCHNMAELQDKLRPRLVELQWSKKQRSEFLAAVKITGDDRPGMLNDITTAVISVDNTNIRGVNIDAFDSLFEGILTVYVRDTAHLDRIFDKLHKIKGVRTVERFEG